MIEKDVLHLPRREPSLLEMVKSRAFMARWVTRFDIGQSTPFWYIIKDKNRNIDEFSKKRRRELKIAESHLDVRRIDQNTMLNHSYRIYLEVFRSYNAGNPLSEMDYKSDILRHAETIYHYWGIYLAGTDTMIGYCVNHDRGEYCNYSVEKILPQYKRFFPSLYVNHVMDNYYLANTQIKFISAGARSIYHDTEIQSFLISKCGYREAYCLVSVKFLPLIPTMIHLCNTFSFLISRSRKLSAILSVLNYHLKLFQSMNTG
jgi:hypothetical protein